MTALGTVVITGASGGIGQATAKALATLGTRVIMACRNPERAAQTRAALLEALPHADLICEYIDLASLKTVREFAARLEQRGEVIDVLINNAGVYCNTRELTEDGFERSIGVNYLGPTALSLSLLSCLNRAKAPRIINLASNAHYRGRLDLDDLMFATRKYDGFRAYATSKLAIVIGTRALARDARSRGVSIYAVHPGHASTNIWPRTGTGWRLVRPVIDLFLVSPEDGAEPSVHLATAPVIDAESGSYFDRMSLREPDARALDEANLSRLWSDTLQLIGERG